MALSPIEQISTPRLTLRPVVAADLADLLEVNGDAEVTHFLPYDTWRNGADATAWFARISMMTEAGTGQVLALVRTRDSKVIGTAQLFKFDEASQRVELGYVLGRADWRQGYMREAVVGLCTHAFRQSGIRRIEAEVNPANIASNELLKALGFQLEGRLRQRWVAKGVIYDTNIYGCLAAEWRGQ